MVLLGHLPWRDLGQQVVQDQLSDRCAGRIMLCGREGSGQRGGHIQSPVAAESIFAELAVPPGVRITRRPRHRPLVTISMVLDQRRLGDPLSFQPSRIIERIAEFPSDQPEYRLLHGPYGEPVVYHRGPVASEGLRVGYDGVGQRDPPRGRVTRTGSRDMVAHGEPSPLRDRPEPDLEQFDVRVFRQQLVYRSSDPMNDFHCDTG